MFEEDDRGQGSVWVFPESETKKQAQGKHSGEEEDEGGGVRVVVEFSCVEEAEADDEVQESPEDVDDGRGQSSAEGSGE